LFNDFIKEKRITLNDSYFLNLFGYADISKAISWSKHFSPRTLSFMRFVLLSDFYFLMLISHPKRILTLIINAFKGKDTTKLEGVLKRVFNNLKASFLYKKKYAK